MGTANNVATTLGVKHLAIDELIFGWTSARRVKFDVGNAKGPWGSKPFIEGLGMGLFTDTMSGWTPRIISNLLILVIRTKS